MTSSSRWLLLSLAVALFVPLACAGPGVEEATPQAQALEEITLIPREALLGNPERFRGRISPDGSKVSYLAPVDGVQNVWVAPVGDIGSAKAVTNDTNRGIAVYRWAVDGVHLLYTQDQGGDENWQVHAVNVETGEDRNLTPIEGVQARILATSWDHPNEILIGLNDRDPRWHDVHRLDISTGESTLVETNDSEMSGYGIDTGLQVRLATRSTPDGGSELHRRGDSGDWEAFLTIPPDDAITTGFGDVASDGRTVYGIDSRGRDTAALVAVDIPTGEVTVLGSNDRADVSTVLSDPVTGKPLAYQSEYTEGEWVAIDEAVADDIATVTAELGGSAAILGQTKDNGKWVIYSDLPHAPGRYSIYDRATGKVELLFNTRPALDGYQLATATAHVIPARDGLDLVSYLTLPPGSDPDHDGVPDVPKSMVLLVHGGPWGRDSLSFNGMCQLLANRGYAVLQTNFRASTGFGKEFVNAGDRAWGTKMHDDLIDAVDWAVARGAAIEDRVAIMGGSYGGYATLAGLTFTPEKFAAGVDIVGPSNLETLMASIPPYWTSLLDLFARRVGNPGTEDGRALLRDRSPLHKADQIVRPLLIGQGANDPRVKQAESDQIVAAMEANELPVTYVLYPDEGHGFQRPPNNLSFYAIAEAFLATHLGGRYEPMSAETLEGSSIQVPNGADLVPGLAEALGAGAEADEEEPAAAAL